MSQVEMSPVEVSQMEMIQDPDLDLTILVPTPATAVAKAKKNRKRKQNADAAARKGAVKKGLSRLARKKVDPRYELNGKGRYVSKLKSANGKRNVQCRAIVIGRELLGLAGMVLLGVGEDGIALKELCSDIRKDLKADIPEEEIRAKYKKAE